MGSINSVYGVENISNENGYALVVGIAGLFTTTASFICWYCHQKMLKKDFAKKDSESFHAINELRVTLNLPLLPNRFIVSISGPGVVERVSVQKLPLWPHRFEQLFTDDEVASGVNGMLPYTSLASLSAYDSFGRLPCYESPIPLGDGRLPGEFVLDHFRLAHVFVGSLNPSPTVVGYDCEGLEEEV